MRCAFRGYCPSSVKQGVFFRVAKNAITQQKWSSICSMATEWVSKSCEQQVSCFNSSISSSSSNNKQKINVTCDCTYYTYTVYFVPYIIVTYVWKDKMLLNPFNAKNSNHWPTIHIYTTVSQCHRDQIYIRRTV